MRKHNTCHLDFLESLLNLEVCTCLPYFCNIRFIFLNLLVNGITGCAYVTLNGDVFLSVKSKVIW